MFRLCLIGLLVALVSADVTCPDQKSSCPDGTTCCLMVSGEYGCCPMPQAVCCADKQHCCPHGTTCDVQHGTCNGVGGERTPLYRKLPSIPHVAANVTMIPCGSGEESCPDGTTCCRTGTGHWGCCPMPEAVCCSDKIHCCPHATLCDLAHSTCRQAKNGRVFGTVHSPMLLVEHPINTPKSVCEDKTRACLGHTTCCAAQNGRTGCCGFVNGVCCEDKNHCCPSGWVCENNSQQCSLRHNHTVRAFMHSSVLHHSHSVGPTLHKTMCMDGSECATNTTCCPTKRGQYACCPIPDAVCCDRTCCPKDHHCSSDGKCLKNVWYVAHREQKQKPVKNDDEFLF